MVGTSVIAFEYLTKHGKRIIRIGEMLGKFNEVGISGSHAAGIKGPWQAKFLKTSACNL
jgi:hypothetical protein